MTHLGFIVAAYGAAVLVLGGLVAWVISDLRTQRKRLAALDGERAGDGVKT